MTDLLQLHQLHVDQTWDGYWILCWPDGSRWDTTKYATAAAAKRALTMLRRA